MPTKDELESENARLAAENEQLKSQLSSVAAGGAAVGTAAVPGWTFELSEAGRQELAISGVTNVRGRLYTREQALAAMAEAGQEGVDIPEAPAATRNEAAIKAAERDGGGRAGIPGLDYIPVAGVDQTQAATRDDLDETDSE